MRKKASDEARLTISLGQRSFHNLTKKRASCIPLQPRLQPASSKSTLEGKLFAVDCEAEIEKLKKELEDYKQHHQREINSLTTELTRLKAAWDFETEEVARLKATSARFL